MIEPEAAEQGAAAEDAAGEVEPRRERIAIGCGELALEQAHHRRVPDREPAHVVGRKLLSLVDHARP